MTQTNIDYLFQSTGPLADRTYGAASSKDAGGRFDDHLSQASTVADDGQRRTASASRQSESSGYSDWKPRNDSYGNDGSHAGSSGHDRSSTSSDTSQRPETSNSAPVADRESPSSDEAQADDEDRHKANDDATSEFAAAGQTATDSSSQTNTKTTPNPNAKPAANSKAIATNQLARKAEQLSASGKEESHASAADAAAARTAGQAAENAMHVAEAANGANQSDGTHNGAPDADQARSAELQTKQQKSDKASALRGKPKSVAAKDAGAASDSSHGETGTGDASAETVAKAAATVASSTELKPTGSAKGSADTDDSSDDDSHRDSSAEARAASRNDLTAQLNKADATAIANTASINTQGRSGNGQAKSDDSEKTVKPISSKGESVTASLARMSRANASSSTNRAAGDDGPRVDPSRFVGRVAKAFQTAQDRGGTLQLRLSPPELGSLRLELTVKDGVMSAALQTENASARRLLLDHLPALRDRLAEQNIHIERFDVDMRREGTGSQTDARGSQHQSFQERPQEPAPRKHVQNQQPVREIAPQAATPVTSIVSDTGLNLIV